MPQSTTSTTPTTPISRCGVPPRHSSESVPLSIVEANSMSNLKSFLGFSSERRVAQMRKKELSSCGSVYGGVVILSGGIPVGRMDEGNDSRVAGGMESAKKWRAVFFGQKAP